MAGRHTTKTTPEEMGVDTKLEVGEDDQATPETSMQEIAQLKTEITQRTRATEMLCTQLTRIKNEYQRVTQDLDDALGREYKASTGWERVSDLLSQKDQELRDRELKDAELRSENKELVQENEALTRAVDAMENEMAILREDLKDTGLPRHNEEQTRYLEELTRSLERQARSLEGQTRSLEGQTRSLKEQTLPLEDQTRAVEGQTQTLEKRTRIVKELARTVEELTRALPTRTVQELTRALDNQIRAVEEHTRILDEQHHMNAGLQDIFTRVNDAHATTISELVKCRTIIQREYQSWLQRHDGLDDSRLSETRRQLEGAQNALVQMMGRNPWGLMVVVCVDVSASTAGYFDDLVAVYSAIISTLGVQSPHAIVGVVTHGHSPRGTVRTLVPPTRVATDIEGIHAALAGEEVGCSTECFRGALSVVADMMRPFCQIVADRRVVLVGDGEADAVDEETLVDWLDGVKVHSLVVGDGGGGDGGEAADTDAGPSTRTFCDITGGLFVQLGGEQGITEAVEGVLFA